MAFVVTPKQRLMFNHIHLRLPQDTDRALGLLIDQPDFRGPHRCIHRGNFNAKSSFVLPAQERRHGNIQPQTTTARGRVQ